MSRSSSAAGCCRRSGRVGLAGVAVAVCVATASASFIAALNHTAWPGSCSSSPSPRCSPPCSPGVTLGEPITRRTVLAMALALAGVALMLGAPGEGNLAGDSLAFLARSRSR